ncbi:MAG: FecR domain-containing protein [Verrucomicrobia bacterium]|nr:FecR domain-containing protein [Verrucomicrobiota bacterium]
MNSPGDDETTDRDLDVVELQATAWLSRRDRGLTPEEAVEFARWRAADGRHEAVVAELGAMWSALDDLSAPRGEVVRFPSPPAESRTRRAGWILWAVAAAACMALIANVALRSDRVTEPPAMVHYETAIGAQRSITLADGSTVRLNTDSAIEVRYSAGERRVELARGEARFAVTKDASRPFIVAAEGTESRALGTVFAVRRREKETELLVTEGRVKFGATGDRAPTVEVGAGQTSVCDPQNPQPPRVQTLDAGELARRVAWERGRLICRADMPLAEVAAEFNRYHRQKLVLGDAETGAVPVGGEFELAKLDALVGALEESFDIVVVERGAERLTLKLRRAGREPVGRDDQ